MPKTAVKKSVQLTPAEIRLCIEGLFAVYDHRRLDPEHKLNVRTLARKLHALLPIVHRPHKPYKRKTVTPTDPPPDAA